MSIFGDSLTMPMEDRRIPECRGGYEVVRSRAFVCKRDGSSLHHRPKNPQLTAVPQGFAPSASEVQDAQRNLAAHKLARYGKLVLFKAPSHFGYMWAGWVGGAICIGGAVLILNQKLHKENKELPWFVPIVYRISAVLLIGLGGWACARPARLLSSIELLPGEGRTKLQLKIRRNVPLPFIQPKTMIVDPADVSFERRMVAAAGKPIPHAQDLKNLDGSVLSKIGGHISLGCLQFFAGVKQFIHSDGLIYVYIRGHGGSWKMNSALDSRRYGEPDWKYRPVDSLQYPGAGFGAFPSTTSGSSLFGTSTLGRDVREFPKYSKSFEEWRLLDLIQSGTLSSEDNSRSLAFGNPLGNLQGSKAMIEVMVGTEKVVWYLHEKILVAGSTFFKTAIASPFKEGHERKVTLAQDDNLIFQLFVQYLYTRTFQSDSLELLLKAYVLGDKLGAPCFQAHSLDKIYTLNHHCCQFTAEQVLWIFESTLPGCGLRRLAADTVAYGTLGRKLDYNKEDWELLAPIMMELMEGVISIASVQDGKENWSKKSRLAYQD